MVYPALLSLMRPPRLPVVDWTDASADLNGLVRFAERRNLVSARVPSHFNWPLPYRYSNLFWPVRVLAPLYAQTVCLSSLFLQCLFIYLFILHINLIILWLFHFGISCTVFVLTCTVAVLTCFVMCGCFGNMCTCIYCIVLFSCIVSFMYIILIIFCLY